MLGHLSGDEFFTRVFVEGRDLHDEVATFLFGKDFGEKDRMKAKTLNFGIPYGREAYSIAMAFDVSMQEAQELIDGWFQRAPQAAAFLQECAASVRQGRVLTTPFGRKRRFGLVTPVNLEDLQREARNFPIQSMTSDIALASSIRLRELLVPFDASIINLVHDSILIELPSDPEVALQVAHIARKCMMEVPHEKLASKIRFEVDIKVGQRWGSLQKLGSAEVAAGEESGELEEIRRIVEKCEEVHYEEGSA
jgi:DNA polymerase-1